MLLFLHGKQNTLVSFSPSFPRPSKLFLQLVPLRDLELNRRKKIIKTDKNIFTDARPLAHLSPGRADDLLPVVLLPLVAPPSAAEVEATNDLEEKTESKIPSLQLLLHLFIVRPKKMIKFFGWQGASVCIGCIRLLLVHRASGGTAIPLFPSPAHWSNARKGGRFFWRKKNKRSGEEEPPFLALLLLPPSSSFFPPVAIFPLTKGGGKAKVPF